jgi:hypothetical protein
MDMQQRKLHGFYLEDAGAVGHHARLVQRRLPVGQHHVAVAQVAVHRLALAGLGGGRTRARQQLLGDRVPFLQARRRTSLLGHYNNHD